MGQKEDIRSDATFATIKMMVDITAKFAAIELESKLRNGEEVDYCEIASHANKLAVETYNNAHDTVYSRND